MKPKKSQPISLRLDDRLEERVARIMRETGLNKADVLRACLEALADSFEKTGKLSFPIQLK